MPSALRWAGRIAGGLVLAFFIVRAVAELFLVDYGDPSSYEADWGGPTLAGVLAVHMLPGVLAAVIGVVWIRRIRRSRTADGS